MRTLIACGLLAASAVVGAQETYDAEQRAEIERQQAFRAGFEAIVADLNSDSLERFTQAVDEDALLERIFGLRLIDVRIKKSFEERFEDNLPDMLEGVFAWSEDTGIKATLLDFDSRGELGRAVVRYDLPDFQFNYHEYDLRLSDRGDVRIVDWIDFLRGEAYSQAVGNSLVAAAPSKQAVRKLIDLPRISETQVFQLTELLKTVRDRRADRFVEIYENLGEDLRAQRIVVLSHAQLMRDTRNRRRLRTALIEMAKHFPNEPEFSLMLLDVYFPSRRYDEARLALERLESRLGVEDAAMKARLSAASLVLGNIDEAIALAEKSVAMEPGLELGWWSLARASVLDSRFEQTVTALTTLEDQFGHSLGPDALAKDRLFQGLLQSDEYRQWSSARHQ